MLTVATPPSAYSRRVAGSSSHNVGAAPYRVRAASTALPVTPPPATSTGAPVTIGSSTSGADRGEPLTVEQGHAQAAGDRGEQPKADDHRGFGPADQLEVVVKGGHPE